MAGESEVKVRKTLYGSESDSTCAYCCYHKKSLTPRQMARHECLRKDCHALLKAEEHPIWKERELRKEKRKARKERLEKLYQDSTKGAKP